MKESLANQLSQLRRNKHLITVASQGDETNREKCAVFEWIGRQESGHLSCYLHQSPFQTLFQYIAMVIQVNIRFMWLIEWTKKASAYKINTSHAKTECSLELPYSQKIWRGIKFGGFRRNRQIKIHQSLYRVHTVPDRQI